MRWRLVSILIFASALALLGLRHFPDQLLPPLAHWLNVGTIPAKADYVLVLPGGYNTRPFVAAALVNRGLARAVLVLQTVSSPEVDDGITPSDHEVVLGVLRKRGLDDDQIILLDGRTGSTFSDAGVLKTFLQSHPGARITAVTTDWHTRRARWTFQRVLGPRMKQVAFVSAPSDEFDASQWWRYEDGVEAIASEYVKLIAYSLCYGTLAWWLTTALVATLLVLTTLRRRPTHPTDSRPRSFDRPGLAIEQAART